MAEVLVQAIDSGHQLVLDNVQLIRVDAEITLAQKTRAALQLAAGGAIGLLGWMVLMATAIVALSPWVDYRILLAVVGGVHWLAGVILLVRGVRAMHRKRQSPQEVHNGPHPRTTT